MALIQIRKLKIPVILGTKPQERIKKQDIFLDILLQYDATSAIATDDLSHAVNYDQLKTNIADALSTSQFFLLEKLAAFVLEIVFQDSKIQNATVTAYKPKALKDTKYVSAELSQKR